MNDVDSAVPVAVGRRPIRARLAIGAALTALAIAAILWIEYGQFYFFPKRFAVVESGQLYRSGLLHAGPLKRIIAEYHLKTILVLLNDEPDDPRQKEEEDIAKHQGVQMIRVAMPGDGCADFDSLDRAAAVIDDPRYRPLLVHCAAGVQRTGASYAAWRMKYERWSLDRAVAEMEKYGYEADSKPKLREHLRAYYETRVAPLHTKPS